MKFDRLVRQKKFVGAVDVLNESLVNIFSPELVDVPAVSSVRDEMLLQKGRILDTLVEEISDVVFLRAATSHCNNLTTTGTTKGRGGVSGMGIKGSANRRTNITKERGGAFGDDTPRHGLSLGHTSSANGGAGPPSDVASESSVEGGKHSTVVLWAGLEVNVADVADDEEQVLDDPSQNFSVYLRLLVEAVRRLRCLDDVERYLLERLSNEVLILSATHMRMCVGRVEEDGVRSRVNGANNSEELSTQAQNLTQYLSLVFDSFTSVLANLMRLVRLLHAARLRNLRENDPGGAPVFDGDAPYKESLVLGLWQHIQTHLTDVLNRHVSDGQRADRTVETGKADGGGMRKINSFRFGLGSSEKSEPSRTRSPSVSYFRPLRRLESSTKGFVSTAVELDHASAAEYCRSRVLAEPSPLLLMAMFRPTLKFVQVQEVGYSSSFKLTVSVLLIHPF